ncbi:MAG: trypsin-like serine protease [Elusimicrobiota bacterium]|jgi:hypothetical protein|nr:trypsin-like serine protease [Elusimicrobiota bacterium]
MKKLKTLAFFALFYMIASHALAQSQANFFDSNNIKNTAATKRQMLSNIYLLEVPPNSSIIMSAEVIPNICTSFRIHKNWLLTAAHCVYKFPGANADVHVRVHEKLVAPKIPGEKDFRIFVGKVDAMYPANAKVFLYKQNYNPDRSASGHSEDLALIYIPDNDKKLSFSKFISLSGVNESSLKQMPASAVNLLKVAHSKAVNDDRSQFLRHPVNNDFHFLTLSEDRVIDELSPVQNPKKYPYTLYKFIDEENTPVSGDKVSAFTMFCNGTKRNTNMLYFYPDPYGGSGSPVFYGNIIVSVASGPDGLMTGPMLTDNFNNFLKSKMGGDYRQGMCIKAAQQEADANAIPIVVPVRRPVNPK